jgi:hypothetical protein
VTTKVSHESRYMDRTVTQTPVSDNTAYPRVGLHRALHVFDDTVAYGDNLPDWKQRLREARSATTSLVGVRTTLSGWPLEYMYTDNGIVIRITGKHSYLGVPTNIDGTLVDKATAIAKQKFAQKARSKITTWQGGVAAGEFREAVKQLASPTRRLRNETLNLLDTLLGLRKGRLRPTKKGLSSLRDAIADTWLEWQYGVKPTISDCQDAYLAFQKVANGRRVDSVTIKATHKEVSRKELGSVKDGLGVPKASGFVTRTMFEESECEVTIRGAYVWRTPDGNFPLPQLFGVDLSSIAPTAYELIPWSFLVDYFTDVGSAIEAVSMRLTDFAWTNYTVRNRKTFREVRPRIEESQFVMLNYKPSVYLAGPYIAKGTRYTINRTAGLPPMVPYKPQFKLPNSSTKWLNIAALLNGINQLKS